VDLEKEIIVETFYVGLLYKTKVMADAYVGGAFMNKSVEDVFFLHDDMRSYSQCLPCIFFPTIAHGLNFFLTFLDFVKNVTTHTFEKVMTLKNLELT